jgi:hypothetical protein
MQTDLIEKTIKIMPSNNINDYIKMGDLAGENGDEDESFQWYLKGLNVAREQGDEEKVNYISGLIITML